MKCIALSFLILGLAAGCSNKLTSTSVPTERVLGELNLKNTYNISSSILNNSAEELTLSSYLAVGIPYSPVQSLFRELRGDLNGLKLKSRGEAHITVLTPIEMGRIQENVSSAELASIAQDLSLQSIEFKPLCLGVGTVSRMQTFYIVVEAPALTEFRQKVSELNIARGGDLSAFNPENFHPHITIGYTNRDLHEQDGVIKDTNSCKADFEIN